MEKPSNGPYFGDVEGFSPEIDLLYPLRTFGNRFLGPLSKTHVNLE